MTEQEKNIKTVKRVFEAFGRGDLASVINSLAETVEWRCPVTNYLSGPVTWARTRRNRREVEAFFRELFQNVTVIELTPLRFSAVEDRVIVEGTDHSKTTVAGIEYIVNWVMVFTVGNGNVKVMHCYFDTAEVSRALQGLSSGGRLREAA